MNHRGATIWLTGLSGSGKSTIAEMLEQRLRKSGARVEKLDGDALRAELCKDLGFSAEDRRTNISRIGYICELLTRNGVIAVVSAISPYRDSRNAVRAKISEFIEIYVECPLETLVARDVKGLYKRALAGEIPHFTGVSDPYEPPLTPEVVVNSSRERPEDSLERIWAVLQQRGIVPALARR
jgi:adenylylsulfate kinase